MHDLEQQLFQMAEERAKKEAESEAESSSKPGCDTCIEYIKRMKRLEFDLHVEREER